jgi:hypothetical protein
VNESNNLPTSINDDAKHVASFPDMSTHVQTNDIQSAQIQSTHVQTHLDNVRFTLTVEEASELLAQAGVPRSPKTVTRFCKDGQLEFTKAKTEKNFKFLIDPKSLERLIKELQQTKGVNAGTEIQSTHVETKNEKEENVSTHVPTHKDSSPDMSRHSSEVASRETVTHVEVMRLDNRERELYEELLNAKNDQIKILVDQLGKKDGQIETMNKHYERFFASERDTKITMGRLQSLMNAIWPRASKGDDADHFVPANEALEGGLGSRDVESRDL